MAKNLKTLHDLGVDLLEVYSELRAGTMEQSVANSLANVSGKVIKALAVQVDYNVVKPNIDKIPLLEIPEIKKINGSKAMNENLK